MNVLFIYRRYILGIVEVGFYFLILVRDVKVFLVYLIFVFLVDIVY